MHHRQPPLTNVSKRSANTSRIVKIGAGALVALTKVVGVTAEAAASTTTDNPFEKSGTPVEGSLGGRFSFSSVVLGTSLSTGLTRGVGSPDLRWLVMLAAPGGHDDAPAPQHAVASLDDARSTTTKPRPVAPRIVASSFTLVRQGLPSDALSSPVNYLRYFGRVNQTHPSE